MDWIAYCKSLDSWFFVYSIDDVDTWEDHVLSGIKHVYNEGSYIADYQNPIWPMSEGSHNPITPTHAPCGYWYTGYVLYDPFILLTSRPYPVDVSMEQAGSIGVSITGGTFISYLVVNIDIYIVYDSADGLGVSILDGELRALLIHYTPLPESIDGLGINIIDGELIALIIHYTPLPESVDGLGVSITDGTLVDLLIHYTPLPESVDALGVSITGGSLA